MLKRFRWATLVVALLGVVLPLGASGRPEVVVGSASGNKPRLRATVKAIFFGTITRWDSGRPIVVFVLPPDHPTTKNFAWNILRVTPYSFEEKISSMVATRDGNLPRVVETETKMLRAIANTPNSIGYLSSFVVINNAHSNIRVIPVL